MLPVSILRPWLGSSIDISNVISQCMGPQQQTWFKKFSPGCSFMHQALNVTLPCFHYLCLWNLQFKLNRSWWKLMFSVFDSDKMTSLVRSMALQTLVLAELKHAEQSRNEQKRVEKSGKNSFKSVLVTGLWRWALCSSERTHEEHTTVNFGHTWYVWHIQFSFVQCTSSKLPLF